MKYIWHLSRILLGLVFIFSGFVKGIDPMGSAYKFTDYFNTWGLESMVDWALPLGILLSVLEFTIGVALVANVCMRLFSSLALLFMVFFTGLTLYIALENPVTDCGCFGDALVLTNWQTFYKNIAFLAFALISWGLCRRFQTERLPLIPAIMSGATVLVFAYLIDYSYKHLPIIDFRLFKIGTNIPESMIVPAGAAQDVYENIFVYENLTDGKKKEFTEENYPWQDTLNWKFVSMESKLIEKGYEPPIHNFNIETGDGEDIRDFFLYDDNYTFMLVSTDMEKADWSVAPRIKELSDFAAEKGYAFIGLTSSILARAEEIALEQDLNFEFFNTDEVTLKTMIRSNPGLILIKKGLIKDKWHFNDIPSVEEFEKQLEYFSQIE